MAANKNYRNNFLQNAEAAVTSEELKNVTRHALETFKYKTPDLHNPEAVTKAIVEYFESCEKNGIRPGNLGLYAYLGMSRQDVNDVIAGKNKSKVSPDCIDIIKKARYTMSTYREALALSGKLSPPVAIFWAKNYDGMSDDPVKVEISAGTPDHIQLTQEELQRRIPVYSDYEQITKKDDDGTTE